MDTQLSFLEYLEFQGKLPTLNNAQILTTNTTCAVVLWDTLRMFSKSEIKHNVLFCDIPWGQNLELKLGTKELHEFVLQILKLDNDFNETEYMKYIIRKIFARYQEEGKINISICYN